MCPIIRASAPGHNGRVRISILGFGLIGGSIARALHERAQPGELARDRLEPQRRHRSSKAVSDGVVEVAAETSRSRPRRRADHPRGARR